MKKIAGQLVKTGCYIRNANSKFGTTYGLQSLIEGNLKYATDRIVVMDDVLYTGKTAQIGIDALQEKELEVVGISTLAKLSEKAENKFKKIILM